MTAASHFILMCEKMCGQKGAKLKQVIFIPFSWNISLLGICLFYNDLLARLKLADRLNEKKASLKTKFGLNYIVCELLFQLSDCRHPVLIKINCD